MSGLYDTPFQESEALLAMQSGDVDHVDTILGDMMNGELRDLRDACNALAESVELELLRRRHKT